MFGEYVRLKVPHEVLLKLCKLKGMPDSPEKAIQELVSRYERQVSDFKELKGLREKDSKALQALKQDLDRSCSEKEELSRSNRDLIQQLAALKVEYHLMEKKAEYMEANPRVQEKIVYRENTEGLAALKKKKDELQQAVWEKEEALRKLKNENAGLNASMTRARMDAENRTRENFALLVMKRGAGAPPSEWDIEARFIGSADYYLWRADEGEFRRAKGIKGPFLMIPIEEIKRQA
jgi:chromosome segregation ATPase